MDLGRLRLCEETIDFMKRVFLNITRLSFHGFVVTFAVCAYVFASSSCWRCPILIVWVTQNFDHLCSNFFSVWSPPTLAFSSIFSSRLKTIHLSVAAFLCYLFSQFQRKAPSSDTCRWLNIHAAGWAQRLDIWAIGEIKFALRKRSWFYRLRPIFEVLRHRFISSPAA